MRIVKILAKWVGVVLAILALLVLAVLSAAVLMTEALIAIILA